MYTPPNELNKLEILYNIPSLFKREMLFQPGKHMLSATFPLETLHGFLSKYFSRIFIILLELRMYVDADKL